LHFSTNSLGSNGKENGSYKANNNGDYLSNSLGWRRKLDEDTSNVVIERKTVITRATSPQPDVSKQVKEFMSNTYWVLSGHLSEEGKLKRCEIKAVMKTYNGILFGMTYITWKERQTNSSLFEKT